MITVIAIYRNGFAVDTYQNEKMANHRINELVMDKGGRVIGVFVYDSTGALTFALGGGRPI